MNDKYKGLRGAIQGVLARAWDWHEHGVGEFVVFDAEIAEGAIVGGDAIAFVDDDPRYRVGSHEQQKANIQYISAADPATVTELLQDYDRRGAYAAWAKEYSRLVELAGPALDIVNRNKERYGVGLGEDMFAVVFREFVKAHHEPAENKR